jgi:hypothetical protein
VPIASVEIKQNAKIVSRSIGLLRRLNITNPPLLQVSAGCVFEVNQHLKIAN